MDINIKNSNPKIKSIKLHVQVGLYNNNENLRMDLSNEEGNWQIEFNDISVFHAKRMIREIEKYIENKSSV